MATPATASSGNKTFLYLVLGLLGLGLAAVVLGLLYVGLSYLALNAALVLDHSPYGQAGGPLGYALLGAGLGAAAGAIAARHRYRLHRGIVAGALVLSLGLLALAAIPASSPAAGPAADEASAAVPYRAIRGRVSCGACTRVVATGAYLPQNGHSYEAANLLRRDSTRAWISSAAADAENPLRPSVQLRLAVGLLPGHRLVGLRLRNGYCKNSGTYQSFGRLWACQLRLPSGEQQAWALPDTPGREFLLPLPAASGAAPTDSVQLLLTVDRTYPGDNHPEVALAWLVPVFEPVR